MPAADLLVVVDDAALDVGRVRFRPRGAPGGHNGLKSVSGALRSDALSAPEDRCGAEAGREWTWRTGSSRPCRRRTKKWWSGSSRS